MVSQYNVCFICYGLHDVCCMYLPVFSRQIFEVLIVTVVVVTMVYATVIDGSPAFGADFAILLL